MGSVYARRRRAPSIRGPKQDFWCGVVSESVVVTLRRPSALETTPGREPKGGRFVVHCDQGECQYFETAGPPCPLRLDLFPTLTAQAKAASRAVTGEEEHARDAA